MRLRRVLRLSFQGLFAHRLRAILAVASVSAGVAAVGLTSAIGTGVEREVRRNIESLGVNLLVVRPVTVKRLVARKPMTGLATTLRLDDYLAITRLPLTAAAAPGVEGPVKVKAGAAALSTMVLGTTPGFLAVRGYRLQSGRFFDAEDVRMARRVAVLGARVAAGLEGEPLGRQIRIRSVPFEVIGILAAKGTLADGDEDDQVVIPIRTALRRVFNTTWLSTVFVSARDQASVSAAEAEIAALLRQRHRPSRDEQPDFEIQNASRLFDLQRQTADALAQLSTGLAAIAFIVGGTGIMALMLSSVKERTSEIGIRIAVGARPRDIFNQFLLEATVLALAGWIGGIGLGAAGSMAVALATAWPLGIPLRAILASLGMALIIGLGFGAIPARKAARVPAMQAVLSR